MNITLFIVNNVDRVIQTRTGKIELLTFRDTLKIETIKTKCSLTSFMKNIQYNEI